MAKDPRDLVTYSTPDLRAAIEARFTPPSFLKGDLEILSEKSPPPRILHRDKEINKVLDIISSAVMRSHPAHLVIYGKTGTGKTAVTKHVVEQVQNIAKIPRPFLPLYVNCRNQVSHHGLLIQIMAALEPGKIIHSNVAAHDLHRTVLKAVREANANVMVILDEVNYLTKVGTFDSLYLLSNMESELGETHSTLSIIAIANDLHFLEKLDAPTQSRLAASKLFFAPYTSTQLAQILRDRASVVFTSDGMAEGVIEYAAAVAARDHGDARKAIALLRKAADFAAKEGAAQVHEDHVREARGELELDVIAEGLRLLAAHDKVVLYAVATLSNDSRTASNLNLGKIHEGYTKACKNLGIDPMVMRSVVRSISELEDQGFLKSEVRAIGQGRGRSTCVTMRVPTESTLRVLQEDSLFDRTRESNPKNTTLDGFGR
jgi:cell division control protein 6